MVLKDRRVSLARAQDEGLKRLDKENRLLRDELRSKKKELDTFTHFVYGLNK